MQQDFLPSLPASELLTLGRELADTIRDLTERRYHLAFAEHYLRTEGAGSPNHAYHRASAQEATRRILERESFDPRIDHGDDEQRTRRSE